MAAESMTEKNRWLWRNARLDHLEQTSARVEPRAHAERERALAAPVTARQAEGDRNAEIRGTIAKHRQQLAAAAAVLHLAEDDAAGLAELAALAQLREHAVERVRLLVHVLEEHDATPEIRGVRGAEQGDED